MAAPAQDDTLNGKHKHLGPYVAGLLRRSKEAHGEYPDMGYVVLCNCEPGTFLPPRRTCGGRADSCKRDGSRKPKRHKLPDGALSPEIKMHPLKHLVLNETQRLTVMYAADAAAPGVLPGSDAHDYARRYAQRAHIKSCPGYRVLGHLYHCANPKCATRKGAAAVTMIHHQRGEVVDPTRHNAKVWRAAKTIPWPAICRDVWARLLSILDRVR